MTSDERGSIHLKFNGTKKRSALSSLPALEESTKRLSLKRRGSFFESPFIRVHPLLAVAEIRNLESTLIRRRLHRTLLLHALSVRFALCLSAVNFLVAALLRKRNARGQFVVDDGLNLVLDLVEAGDLHFRKHLTKFGQIGLS